MQGENKLQERKPDLREDMDYASTARKKLTNKYINCTEIQINVNNVGKFFGLFW